MTVVYREITKKKDLFECLKLQQIVFGLNELQTIPMLILDALGNYPSRSGLAVGAYDTDKNKLVGFSINICTQKPDTMFIVASGLIPEYRNSKAGLQILDNVYEIARERGFHYVEFYFNPLKHNLGRTFINYNHVKGIGFEYNAFPEYENSHRIFAYGQTKPAVEQKQHKSIDMNATSFLIKDLPEYIEERYLLPIPSDGEVTTFFFQTLDRLINHEGYIMEDCLTLKREGKRQNYYLLQKGDINHLF